MNKSTAQILHFAPDIDPEPQVRRAPTRLTITIRRPGMRTTCNIQLGNDARGPAAR